MHSIHFSYYAPCYFDTANKQWFMELDHEKTVFMEQLFRYHEESRSNYGRALKALAPLEEYMRNESR